MVASVVLAAFADAIEASRTTSYTTSAGEEWRWIVAEGRLVRPTMSLRANQWCSSWGRVVARDGTLTEVEIGGTYKSISVPVPGAAPGACGTSIMCKLHRIVCWTFHGGPRDASQTVDHVNRRCWDNRASNLRWATLEEQLSNRQRIQGTIEYVAELDEHGRMRSMLGASIRSNVAATQMLDVSREDLQGALKRAYCEIQDSVRDSGSPGNTWVTVNVKSGSGDAQQRLRLGITNLHAVQVAPPAFPRIFVPRQRQERHRDTLRLFVSPRTVSDIMEMTGLARSTVVTHITRGCRDADVAELGRVALRVGLDSAEARRELVRDVQLFKERLTAEGIVGTDGYTDDLAGPVYLGRCTGALLPLELQDWRIVCGIYMVLHRALDRAG